MNDTRQTNGTSPARRLARGLCAALLLFTFPGCGGGGFSASGGIGGSGYVYGPIEELGSIVVDGVHFSIDDATIVTNGEPAAATDLTLGMYVGVFGSFDEDTETGTAMRVEFEETVSGPVTFVGVAGRRITVLRQSVLLDESTRFVGVASGDIETGMIVTVSGTRNADGQVVATLVRRRQAAEGCRILGNVVNLNVTGTTFHIGDLEIDATSALIVGGQLTDDDPVGVHALNCDSGSALMAVEVRRLDATRTVPEGDLRRVRGFVLERVSRDLFVLGVPTQGRVRVRITAKTSFEGGDEADLIRNKPLRVAGVEQADGSLKATRILFVPEP